MKDIQGRRCLLAELLTAAGVSVLVGVGCRVATSSANWDERWGPVVSHRTFPGDCGICHATGDWSVIWKGFSFDHEKETGHCLAGAHVEAACLRCHNDRGPVADYAALGCGGCHADPHVSVLGTDCESCHGPENWKPISSVGRGVLTPFHRIPAHSVPPCDSCHARPTADQPKAITPQCDPCHGARLDG